MTDGITVRILGDFGPFSRLGKSIAYQVTIGESTYLIDCGAPLFQQLGSRKLREIKGLIITHCHDDHNRWFTDLALFNMYESGADHKVFYLASEDVHDELVKASGPALDRSLSNDSKNIIDIACEQYTDYRIIGPRAGYRIIRADEGRGKTALYIIDRNGNIAGPDTAKIVISEKTKRPRMLFKDPDYREWVEPEGFYPFSSTVFYEEDKNIYHGPGGFAIEAIKAPVWHGIPCTGIKITTGRETLVFSSDTVHNKDLWQQLYTEKRTQRLKMSKKEFDSAAVLYGDINDYIERVWSEERYREASAAFNDAVVIHDVSAGNSIVHTDYEKLDNTFLEKDYVLLTHSLDRITSEWALCDTGKRFRIRGKRFFEMVADKLYPMNADIYHKEAGRYYVGYRSEKGRYMVYEKDGLPGLCRVEEAAAGKPLYRVEMYEDISGRYLPKLESKDTMYMERTDGRIELVEFTNEGSRGRIVEDYRDSLTKGGAP